MTKRFHKVIRAVAALAFLAPVLLTGAAGHARADTASDSPAEMLQDGLEALLDRQRDLAAELFQQLISAFPASPEASRAKTELNAMAAGNPPSDEDARDDDVRDVGFVERLSDPELRMKFAVEAGDRVFFAENSAVIGGRARVMLEHQARWLVKRPNLRVTIVGRSDDGVPSEAARDIAAQRAQAVRERLIANGVAASRIAVETRGSRDPIATCTSPLCQAQNRHAETVIGTTSAAELPRGGDRIPQ